MNDSNKVQATITKYLGDLHALESHGQQAIARQTSDLKGKDHPETLRLLENFQQTLQQHLNRLDQRLKAMGGSPTEPVKEAVSAAAGVIAGLYNVVRNEQAAKSLRDDYAFLSLDGVSYLMLYTTARGLGDNETANLAEQGYRDCATMVSAIDDLLPDTVVQELRQDGFTIPEVAVAARQLITSSWQAQTTPSSGMAPTLEPAPQKI